MVKSYLRYFYCNHGFSLINFLTFFRFFDRFSLFYFIFYYPHWEGLSTQHWPWVKITDTLVHHGQMLQKLVGLAYLTEPIQSKGAEVKPDIIWRAKWLTGTFVDQLANFLFQSIPAGLTVRFQNCCARTCTSCHLCYNRQSNIVLISAGKFSFPLSLFTGWRGQPENKLLGAGKVFWSQADTSILTGDIHPSIHPSILIRSLATISILQFLIPLHSNGSLLIFFLFMKSSCPWIYMAGSWCWMTHHKKRWEKKDHHLLRHIKDIT